ncbi:MAG: hypothetical protein IID49_03920 [Proteobacteria bacterium]|nr:hypothetical protein [Pseudomonadota bacterium]
MDQDAFNMSMRKFLKQVGVTAQQQIEQAVRAAAPTGPVKVRAVITIPEIGMEHVIEGEISTGGAE